MPSSGTGAVAEGSALLDDGGADGALLGVGVTLGAGVLIRLAGGLGVGLLLFDEVAMAVTPTATATTAAAASAGANQRACRGAPAGG